MAGVRRVSGEQLHESVTATGRCGVLVVGMEEVGVGRDLDQGTRDRVLAIAAARLSAQLRPGDTLAQHGDVEFVILAPGASRSGDVERLADRVLDGLSGPVSVDGRTLLLDARAGLAVNDDDAGGGAALDRAARALQEAKRDGTRWHLCSPHALTCDENPSAATAAELARLLDASGSATIVADRDGTVLLWDAGASTLFGWSRGLARGRALAELLPGIGTTDQGASAVKLEVDGRDGAPLEVLAFRSMVAAPDVGDVVVVLARPTTPPATTAPAHVEPPSLVVSRLSLVAAERAARLVAQEAVDELTRLHRVMVELAGARTVPEVVQLVTKAGVGAVDADSMVVYALDAPGNQLRLLGAPDVPSDVLERFRRILLDADLPITEAARSGEAVWLASFEERLRRFPASHVIPASCRSMVALPLVVENQVLGVLGVAFDTARHWTCVERLALTTLASVCAPALHRVLAGFLQDAPRPAGDDELPADHADHADPEPAEPVVRVLYADPQQTVADALALSIDAEQDLACQGTVGSLEEALSVVGTDPPDVVLLDGTLADLREGDAARRVQDVDAQVKVVVLAGQDTLEMLGLATASHDSRLVAKESPMASVLAAVRAAAARGGGGADGGGTDTGTGTGGVPLTPRERTVLSHLADGVDPKGIAGRLGISVHTCRGHIRTLLAKLDAHSQLEAVAKARRLGIISETPD